MGLNELADIFDKKTRSKIMSRVKGKNTKPEL
ncbi:very short patch repair endonuclease [Alphaproteobacteria bacterium]|nr:very short patch repair endonuclease [Alphaproteobacteria bacterium]MDA8625521.1 very short patch repair endonuclease [Alphaproteobacteria bacterium]MDB2540973.1 very short patch repair endonuclease [Alphaproteobacteria bacterium]MDB2626395.1 very short patch repair endonuclease [Alphaproteobacteria bacterium]MDC0473723.1 very short patch repair endonuclease [Alphaproteobacteria bacterium]